MKEYFKLSFKILLGLIWIVFLASLIGVPFVAGCAEQKNAGLIIAVCFLLVPFAIAFQIKVIDPFLKEWAEK